MWKAVRSRFFFISPKFNVMPSWWYKVDFECLSRKNVTLVLLFIKRRIDKWYIKKLATWKPYRSVYYFAGRISFQIWSGQVKIKSIRFRPSQVQETQLQVEVDNELTSFQTLEEIIFGKTTIICYKMMNLEKSLFIFYNRKWNLFFNTKGKAVSHYWLNLIIFRYYKR